MDDFLTENIKYLLWKEEVSKDRWPDQLANWIGKDVRRAEEVLSGARLGQEEWERLTDMLSIDLETLYQERLAEGGKGILAHNIIYLIDSFPKKNKDLAGELGIRANYLSNWCAGKNSPSSQNQAKLLAFFGIAAQTDLSDEPLFLSREPVGLFRQKQWLIERIEQLGKDDMDAFFPALKKLLS